MTKQRNFGSADGSIKKLETVQKYADFYSTVLKSKFNLTYIDAFAGSGRFQPKNQNGQKEILPNLEDDYDDVFSGSAIRALQVRNPFNKYIFSDIKKSNVKELESLKQQFPDLSHRIEVSHLDANELVMKYCRSMGNLDRALLFLDPFGNQVNFETLRVIANTKKIDMFYLFPSWWGVVRQVSQQGEINPSSEQSLTRLFGTDNWQDELIKMKPEPDLFSVDNMKPEKIADTESITRYMIKRMKSVFGDGVSDRWLPLGKNGRDGHSLLFACANDAKIARDLAKRVSKDIMKRK